LDYYQVLRLAPNASRKEIEQAYHRLLKESRYDTSIDRLMVENAYRTLSDRNTKSQYDARQTLKVKRIQRVQKKKRIRSLGVIEWIKRRTLSQLLGALVISLIITTSFYTYRYGYLLKTFQAGDVLYDTLTDQKFGKVLRVESNHSFGDKIQDAYQIELSPTLKRADSSKRIVWLPQNTVQIRCYKKE
jgi:curved DNA-binding protein CbpA